jgi:hypothetical protein
MDRDRVRDVFVAAVERPEGERDALPAELCAGDADLRREVESLLAIQVAQALGAHAPAREDLRHVP